MLFRVSNLGPIRTAEIDLSQELIVLTGPNNTGKTYLTWAVYGLVPPPKFGSFFGRKDGIQQWIGEVLLARAQGRSLAELPLSIRTIESSIAENLVRRLPDEFASSRERFVEADVKLVCNEADTRKWAKRSARIELDGKPYRLQSRGESFWLVSSQDHLVSNDQAASAALDPPVLDDALSFAIRVFILAEVLDFGTIVFPVERLAINLFARELAANRTQLVDELLERQHEETQRVLRRRAGRYPRVIRDALQRALKLRSGDPSPFADLADELECKVLGGRLSKTEFDELEFTPTNSSDAKPLGLHQSASVIKSLASLVWHLRYDARPGERLIIDEPELNLHPDNQRKVARVLAKAVNRGLKIMMSTHSDYLVRELNNLIMLSQDSDAARGLVQELGIDPESTIRPDKLGVYLVQGGECRPVDVTETGFEVKTIDEEIHRLNRDAQTIYSRLFDE